jgi:hypothetical protein
LNFSDWDRSYFLFNFSDCDGSYFLLNFLTGGSYYLLNFSYLLCTVNHCHIYRDKQCYFLMSLQKTYFTFSAFVLGLNTIISHDLKVN